MIAPLIMKNNSTMSGHFAGIREDYSSSVMPLKIQAPRQDTFQGWGAITGSCWMMISMVGMGFNGDYHPMGSDYPQNIDRFIAEKNSTPRFDQSLSVQFMDSTARIWQDRAEFLAKLQALGRGWDGFDAPAPNVESVKQALAVMQHLKKFIDRPPQLIIDEDGDVTLTWGHARAGTMILLTVDSDTLYLHVLHDTDTVFPMQEYKLSDASWQPVWPAIQIIVKYMRNIG